MLPRARAVVAALAAVALAAGCASDDGPRPTGDPVTAAETELLAGLLHRNVEEGGADFVVTAPYGPTAVLTLTGEIDFAESTGRAEAVTTYGDDRDDVVATVFFTEDEVWIGDLPGQAEALAADGAADGAFYLRRPVSVDGAEDAPLLDVVVAVLSGLGAAADDEPRAFVNNGYTWQGQRSIDSRLTSLFRLPEGRSVAVTPEDEALLVQYAAPLPGGIDVTVTLSDHGPRVVDLPPDEESAAAADHPAIAAALGL